MKLDPSNSAAILAQALKKGSLQLADHLPDGVLFHDGLTILYANQKLADIAGVSAPSELLGAEKIPLLIHPDSLDNWLEWIERLKNEKNKQINPLEVSLATTQETPPLVEATTCALKFQGRKMQLTVLRDISYRQQTITNIKQQSNNDALTGLPNRALFIDRLGREIIRAERGHSHLALMFVDLDRFKWVNDTMGHAAGDELLKQVAKRLQNCSRRSDTVARLGGDEFTLILPDMKRGDYAERVAGNILEQLAKVFILDGQEAFISGSIGITVYPDDAKNLEDLLKNADSAMYRAKHDGRNAYRFFTPDMHAEAMARIAMEKDLRRCLSNNQLELNFQPIVNLESGQLVGAECFLRWNHPERGTISPDAFIFMAEEIGMSHLISEWTFRTACQQAQLWRQATYPDPFYITINVSCTRCRDFSFDEKIAEILQETGLPADALVLEITENILSGDADRAMAMLFNLKELGVRLWLDDFGTGHSSLSLLKRLPLDGIKIDRAFTPDVTRDNDTAALVQAIISLGSSMNLIIIAEGIEGKPEMEFLRKHGCHFGQGYLFDKPSTATKFTTLLRHQFSV